MASSRKRTYLLVRLGAAVAFLVGVLVLPRGLPAGLLVLGAGLVAVLSSIWSNAGSSGERYGANEQNRWFDSVSPPQGDWPPYAPPPPPERDAP